MLKTKLGPSSAGSETLVGGVHGLGVGFRGFIVTPFKQRKPIVPVVLMDKEN